MLGATQAGIAFSNSSRRAGSRHEPADRRAFPRRRTACRNAMLLPAVTAFSAEAALSRYADCARAMGIVAADATTTKRRSPRCLMGCAS